MASQSKTAVNVVFSAMTIGNGDEQSLMSDLDEAKQILDIFQSRGHSEVDTARFYGGAPRKILWASCTGRTAAL